MGSRMDRYKEIDSNSGASRSSKNQELYQNLGTNTKYTNFTDVSRLDAVSLSDASKKQHTREGYQQIKKYDQIIDSPKSKKELEDLNYLYQDYENRVYDINSVLEEAKKNRIEKDQLEAKRKLKNTNYNILAELDRSELEKYREEKEKNRTSIEENGLKEIIHTITSKTLAGELSKETSLDLLSDLMGSKIEEKTLPASSEVDIDHQLSLSKEILDKDSLERIEKVKREFKENLDNTNNSMKNMDKSFYTRSMDLSDKDFDMDFEFSDDIRSKKVPVIVKIILIVILIAAIALTVYFTVQNF